MPILGINPWLTWCWLYLGVGFPDRYAKRLELRLRVGGLAIFNAANRPAAEALLAQTVTKYAESAPRLAEWMETNIPEGLTAFAFPSTHYQRIHQRIRTANGLERLHREIRRRSRVAVLFPNEASCLRLVTAVLMEISEEWETGHTYLRLDVD